MQISCISSSCFGNSTSKYFSENFAASDFFAQNFQDLFEGYFFRQNEFFCLASFSFLLSHQTLEWKTISTISLFWEKSVNKRASNWKLKKLFWSSVLFFLWSPINPEFLYCRDPIWNLFRDDFKFRFSYEARTSLKRFFLLPYLALTLVCC